jgi:hypothetical protein
VVAQIVARPDLIQPLEPTVCIGRNPESGARNLAQ